MTSSRGTGEKVAYFFNLSLHEMAKTTGMVQGCIQLRLVSKIAWENNSETPKYSTTDLTESQV